MTEIDYDLLAEKIAERVAPPPDDRPLLSPRDIAARLNISEREAREKVKEGGVIPSIKVGGLRRVEAAVFDRYVASLRESE